MKNTEHDKHEKEKVDGTIERTDGIHKIQDGYEAHVEAAGSRAVLRL